jgi:protein-S-isoprenylcysteine O-methyltransferase Ste14
MIMLAIVALGFWSPWIAIWNFGVRTPLLEWLALELSRMGLMSFTVAAPTVIILGSVFAAVGAITRVWGTAYLGYGTVRHEEMQAGAVMADGPFRFVRNPLYIGAWFMFAAMAFLMPPTGALFSMALLTVFLLRLILGEEDHLLRNLGEPYKEYLRTVPRLFPRLRTNLPAGGQKPQWLVALLTEVNPIGVFITLAFLSWSYDHLLMLKGILISVGISMVVRALMPRGHGKPDPA